MSLGTVRHVSCCAAVIDVTRRQAAFGKGAVSLGNIRWVVAGFKSLFINVCSIY